MASRRERRQSDAQAVAKRGLSEKDAKEIYEGLNEQQKEKLLSATANFEQVFAYKLHGEGVQKVKVGQDDDGNDVYDWPTVSPFGEVIKTAKNLAVQEFAAKENAAQLQDHLIDLMDHAGNWGRENGIPVINVFRNTFKTLERELRKATGTQKLPTTWKNYKSAFLGIAKYGLLPCDEVCYPYLKNYAKVGSGERDWRVTFTTDNGNLDGVPDMLDSIVKMRQFISVANQYLPEQQLKKLPHLIEQTSGSVQIDKVPTKMEKERESRNAADTSGTEGSAQSVIHVPKNRHAIKPMNRIADAINKLQKANDAKHMDALMKELERLASDAESWAENPEPAQESPATARRGRGRRSA